MADVARVAISAPGATSDPAFRGRRRRAGRRGRVPGASSRPVRVCRRRTPEPGPAASPTLGPVDIRIGIVNSPRELNFESSQTAAEIEKVVADALGSAATFVKLTDDKGKVYIVPTASLAYLEVGSEESRRIGFVA